MRFIPHSAMSLMVYSSMGFIPHSAMRFMAYISMGFCHLQSSADWEVIVHLQCELRDAWI